MHRLLTVLSLLSLVLLTTVLAQDQYQYRPGGPAGSRVPRRYDIPWGYGGGYHHASTYEEGVQRGFADVVRSQGLANLYNSEAAKNYEEARRQNLQNRVLATDTWFDLRERNRQLRATERGPRPTTEALIRYAQASKPTPLTQSELDPVSGIIRWPEILRGQAYVVPCKRLQELFEKRAIFGGLSAESVAEVSSIIDQLRADLKANIKEHPPQQYLDAKKFLDSLALAAYRKAG